MSKKYKGFKGSGYNKSNKKIPKYHIERIAKAMAKATLSKFGIYSKY